MAAKYPEDSTLDDKTSCLICTEPYKDPKILPCEHTFCTGCLDKYFATVQQNGAFDPGTMPCPVCRTIIMVEDQQGMEGLKIQPKISPKAMQSLVQKLNSKKVCIGHGSMFEIHVPFIFAFYEFLI